MITIDYGRLGLRPGHRVLDVGCGPGRHAFEAHRRGAHVVALDRNGADLLAVRHRFEAMARAGEVGSVAPGGPPAEGSALRGDARAMPFPDGHFDRVIAAEVLEHIEEDAAAIREIARVLRPGGLAAITVPRWWPERVCWLLSDAYHGNEGGHIRIYRGAQLRERLGRAGLDVVDGHHAHALHAPYWWLKCAVGVDRDVPPVRAYHRLLVWDLMKAPRLTRWTERALNPVLGKSLVLYARKPVDG